MSETAAQSPIRSAPIHQRQPLPLAKRISGRLEQGAYSELRRYGLRRDLNEPLKHPKSRIPISIHPLQESDLDILLPAEGGGSEQEDKEIRWRRDFYKKLPHSCYVAVDEREGTPCYMQWLIGAKDNDTLARFKCFPRLADNEALLEQAYTPPSYRGRYIMPAAMAKIAEFAPELGARYVLTFVEEKNTPSIKGCLRAGFHLHLWHRRVQMGYGTVVLNDFEVLAEDNPRRNMTF
jgi:RimJ/RimL family protein N-acetyltransferase